MREGILHTGWVEGSSRCWGEGRSEKDPCHRPQEEGRSEKDSLQGEGIPFHRLREGRHRLGEDIPFHRLQEEGRHHLGEDSPFHHLREGDSGRWEEGLRLDPFHRLQEDRRR